VYHEARQPARRQAPALPVLVLVLVLGTGRESPRGCRSGETFGQRPRFGDEDGDEDEDEDEDG